MNLTLSVDERVVERARKVARSMGLSLNQAVRNYLDELAGGLSVDDEIREMKDLSRRSKGRMKRWRFDRERLHERS
jgi:hypothetical protein